MNASEESGSEYRKTHLILVSFVGFLPLPLVGYGVSLIFTASLCSSKNGSLAITSFKNEGRYLVSFCKKPFSVSAHTCPFRRLRRHLSLKAKRLTHFYSVAPLLEKWFACFPTSGDGFLYELFPYF